MHYCYAQGITKSQNLARQLELYLFYGKAKLLKKYLPCLQVLHKKIVNGMHRFTVEHKTRHNFAKFIDLIETKPELRPFLTDKGQGEAPLEYLVAVEAGLRMTAKDKFAMGTRAYDSEARYNSVELWRKREAYIGAARVILECKNYLKYVSYRWSDYVMRNRLHKTFMARHWKHTNGESDELKPHFVDNFGNNVRNYPKRKVSNRRNQNDNQQKDQSENNETKKKRYWDSDDEMWKDME